METPPENTHVEQYLDTLCAWLALMPPTEREEARQEVRQHLVSLIIAEERNGLGSEEVVAVALRRIGPADKLGQQMHATWLDKNMRQFAPIFNEAVQKQKSVFRYWSLAFLLIWLGGIFALLLIFPAYATWPVFLALGGAAGTVNGTRLAMFRASLPEKRPPNPVAIAEAYRSLLPPLPDQPSLALKRQHRKKAAQLLWIKSHMERPSNQLYSPDPAAIRLEIELVTYTAASAFVMNFYVYHYLHLNLPAFNSVYNVAEASASMFLMQELSAVTVSRFLYHKKQVGAAE